MHDSPISRKEWVTSLIIALLFGCISLVKSSHQSFVVFCNVGQGDASYIHIKPRLDILIDAGKNASVVNCLGKYMPITDRTIEIAFITHFQIDHYGGYTSLLDRYKIEQLIISTKAPDSKDVNLLLQAQIKKGGKIVELTAGDSVKIGDMTLEMIWPPKESALLPILSKDPNNVSQVMKFTRQGVSIFYTGDATPQTLNLLLGQPISKVDILKVPHHGSKNGLIDKFLNLADPTYAVISLGKNNSYGHPAPEIITMLNESGVKILRTDELKDIIFNLE